MFFILSSVLFTHYLGDDLGGAHRHLGGVDGAGEAGLGGGVQPDVDGRGYKVQIKIVYPFFP
jgi:hypothetical protein